MPARTHRNPSHALRELLLDMLNERELRRLLSDLFGRAVVQALPRGVSDEDVCGGAVDVLERRGLVTAELFEELVAHAPRRRDEVAAVARMWGVAVPGESSMAVLAVLETLHDRLREPDPTQAFAVVLEHQKTLFPPRAEAMRSIETSVTVWPEQGVMLLATLYRTWSSGEVENHYLAVVGRDVALLQPAPPASGGRWIVSDACRAAVDGQRGRHSRHEEPFVMPGNLHVFLGSRGEVMGDAEKLAAWTAAKHTYAAERVVVRTMEGLVDQLASRALGPQWYTFIPPTSRLARPM